MKSSKKIFDFVYTMNKQKIVRLWIIPSETCIRVNFGKGRSPAGANPRKICNRFLNNYKTDFGLKQRLICGAKLAFSFFMSLINP